jgi:hypothetical protein
MPDIRGPWIPAWTPATVRRASDAERLDRKSTLGWWLVLVLGSFFAVSLLLAFLL